MDDSTTSPVPSPFLLPQEDGLLMRETGAWATEKLDYLRRYLEIFTTSMHKEDHWRGIHFIDLFSGPGKCKVRRTKQILLGSPLLAVNLRYPFSRYFFADMDQAAIDALKTRCSHSLEAKNIYYHIGDSNKVVADIITQIERIDRQYIQGKWRSLNLAFLDPEGLELEWSTVAALAKVNRMDLVIYYPQMGLNREMSKHIQLPPPTRIDTFFGGTEWRQIYQKKHSGEIRNIHRALMDLYEKKLEGLGYVNVRENEPLMRNIARKAPLYRLIFASKHLRGVEFWEQVTKRDVYGQKKLF